MYKMGPTLLIVPVPVVDESFMSLMDRSFSF